MEHAIDPPPLPPFARNTVTSGRRIAATVPVAAATDAVQWAEAAHRARAAEEFAVGPTTLEDVYVLRE